MRPTRPTRRGTTLPAEGLLLVDKPADVTSHDVVAVARRALGERRIGHLGTLDPFATGLLVLLVGRATRLAPYLDGEPKAYEASVRFGWETTTDDATGEPTHRVDPPDPERVRAALTALTGAIEQRPPAFSAKKVAGERAYAAAREGREVDLRPVRVTVHEWRVRAQDAERLDATIVCGGGTYIRALARDLGRLAGSAAHLATLRRTHSGPFAVADAVSLDGLRTGDAPLRSPLDGLGHLASERVADDDRTRLARGMAVPASAPGDRAALVDAESRVLAIAERVGDRWQPRVVLAGD